MPDYEYVPVSKDGTAISKALVSIWERFGRPEDFSNNTGKALLQETINVWKYFFRQEYLDTISDNALDIKNEKHVSSLKMGYSPIVYPPTLFNLIKALFPNVNLASRKSQRVMQELAPFLKSTNLKI